MEGTWQEWREIGICVSTPGLPLESQTLSKAGNGEPAGRARPCSGRGREKGAA